MPSGGILDRIRAGIVNTSFVQLSDSGPRQEVITVQTVTTPRVVRSSFVAASRRCPAGYALSMTATRGYEVCTCNQEHPDVVDCDRRMILLRVSKEAKVEFECCQLHTLVSHGLCFAS